MSTFRGRMLRPSRCSSGSCGTQWRGELANFDPEVQGQLLKLVSIGLCSNTLGQLATGLMVKPPKAGDPSKAKWDSEREAILSSMKRRAVKLVDGLNSLEGVSCNAPQGAMYAFPQITLPPKAVAAADAAGKVPDTFYALALLEPAQLVFLRYRLHSFPPSPAPYLYSLLVLLLVLYV